jgi:hypothetical protein
LASSSSLSALAAPTGECPEDPSSPAPPSLNHDDKAIQSNSRSTSCTTATFASNIVTDNQQSRALLDGPLSIVPQPISAIFGAIFDGLHDKKYPNARAGPSLNDLTGTVTHLTENVSSRAAPDEESGETDSPQDSSSPADTDADDDADGGGSSATPAPPSPPPPPALKLPVELPVTGAPAGRRDTNNVVAELMSPPPPRNPPNTPVQRGFPGGTIAGELPLVGKLPVKLQN